MRAVQTPSQIGVEVMWVVLGGTACLIGLVAMRSYGWQSAPSWLAVVLGVLGSGASLAALILQHRLLRSPVRADDQHTLVVRDIVLGIGLRDLMVAAGIAPLSAYFVLLYWFELSWWETGLGMLATGVLLHLVDGPGFGPRDVPVAHALAGSPGGLSTVAVQDAPTRDPIKDVGTS